MQIKEITVIPKKWGLSNWEAISSRLSKITMVAPVADIILINQIEIDTLSFGKNRIQNYLIFVFHISKFYQCFS